MNAIAILKKDHKEIKEVLHSISKSNPTAVKTREKLVKKLHFLIKQHTSIEEKLIYPLGMKDPKLEKITREAYEEHVAVNLLLKKLLKIEVNDENWLAKCTVIKENLEHHIEEEESEFFPALEKFLSKDDLIELGKKILTLKGKFIIEE